MPISLEQMVVAFSIGHPGLEGCAVAAGKRHAVPGRQHALASLCAAAPLPERTLKFQPQRAHK